jgi:flagellar hook-length control protein FliK
VARQLRLPRLESNTTSIRIPIMTTSANLASVNAAVAPQVPAAPAADAAASGQDAAAATGFATVLASQVELLKRGSAEDAKALDILLAGLAEQVADPGAGIAVPASPIDTSLLQAWIAQAFPQAQPQPTAQTQAPASPDGAAVQTLPVADARSRSVPVQAATVQAGESVAIPDAPAQLGVPAAKDIVLPTADAPAQFAATLGAAAESAIAKPVAEAEPAAAPDLPLPAAENITLGAARPAHAAQESQPTPGARIESALGSRQWTEDVGQKIVWAAGRGESRAELVLHPPHLGRVEVAITVSSNGDSTALFVSANPQVRDALEQSLPRLREIMAEAGIALGQASVQSDSAPRDDREQQNGTNAGGRLRAGAADLPLAEPGAVRQGSRMVDIFA